MPNLTSSWGNWGSLPLCLDAACIAKFSVFCHDLISGFVIASIVLDVQEVLARKKRSVLSGP